MIDQLEWSQLEASIDDAMERRDFSEDVLDQIELYRTNIIKWLFDINDVPVNLSDVESLEAKPLNIVERLDFISADSFHYMRYQQMRSMRDELKKLSVIMTMKRRREQ